VFGVAGEEVFEQERGLPDAAAFLEGGGEVLAEGGVEGGEFFYLGEGGAGLGEAGVEAADRVKIERRGPSEGR